MRHFISLVVWLVVCTTCKAVEPQKIAVNDVMISFRTNIEQYHRFYGAGDFVANIANDDCTQMKVTHLISVRNGRLTIDENEDTEEVYKINSCTYAAGKVFKDRGVQEIYTLSCTDNDGSLTTINISKVKDGSRNQTIVCVISYDEYEIPTNITILHQ